MIVVLTGAPGAGKGTQADMLSEKLGLRKLSTGDALRKHVKEGTDIGKKAGAIMERGELVPDDVLFNILAAEMKAVPADKIVLLDGYPRNISQAETLETLKDRHPVKAAIHLDVSQAALVERLSGRRVCGSCGATYHVSSNPSKIAGKCDKCSGELTQRKDDKPESVVVRLQVYEKTTRPILDFYEAKGLYKKVDGQGLPSEIYNRLSRLIGAI